MVWSVFAHPRLRRGVSTRKLHNALVAPSDVGDVSMPDYASLSAQATHSFSGGKGLSWAGQADDSFFLDLRVFDLLYGENFSEAGTDSLAGFNVNAYALQVPITDLTNGGDGSGRAATATPPSLPAEQRERARKLKRLLAEWMADESGHDEEMWPKLKAVLEEDRLSSRKLFRETSP